MSEVNFTDRELITIDRELQKAIRGYISDAEMFRKADNTDAEKSTNSNLFDLRTIRGKIVKTMGYGYESDPDAHSCLDHLVNGACDYCGKPIDTEGGA